MARQNAATLEAALTAPSADRSAYDGWVRIDRLDHLVLTVADIDATVDSDLLER